MTAKQLAILNSLITFAAENIPGGLKEDEREVAQIVGAALLEPTLKPAKEYDYRFVNASIGGGMEEIVNRWAEQGWRLVAVVSDTRPGYAHSLIFEGQITTPGLIREEHTIGHVPAHHDDADHQRDRRP